MSNFDELYEELSKLNEAPIGVDSSEYVDLNNVSNIHIDSSTGDFVGVRTQQGERPEYVIGNVDDIEDTELSIKKADKANNKEFIDNTEQRKELAKKILSRADRSIKNGSDLAQKNEALEEDFDTSTTEGKLKDIIQIIVDEYDYDDIQSLVSDYGYNLAEFGIIDKARLDATITVKITSEDIPYYDDSVNNIIKEIEDTVNNNGLAEYGIKFDGGYNDIRPDNDDEDDYDDDQDGDGEIDLYAYFTGRAEDVENFIRSIAGEGDSDFLMHMSGMVSGEALEELDRRYDDFYEAADHNFEYEDRYRESTFEVYFD